MLGGEERTFRILLVHDVWDMVKDKNDEVRTGIGGDRPEHLSGIRHAFRSLGRAKKEVTDENTVIQMCTVGTVVRTLCNKTERRCDDGNRKSSPQTVPVDKQ